MKPVILDGEAFLYHCSWRENPHDKDKEKAAFIKALIEEMLRQNNIKIGNVTSGICPKCEEKAYKELK